MMPVGMRVVVPLYWQVVFLIDTVSVFGKILPFCYWQLLADVGV